MKRIIIVDSNISFLMSARAALSMRDFQIMGTFENPKSSIDKIKEERPDIVLLDIVFLYNDGLDFLKTISIISPKTIFIVVSYMKNEAVINEAIRLGASLYVTKPFNYDILATKINRLFDKESSQTSTISNSIIKNMEKDIENLITEEMMKLSIPTHIKGYKYIKTAVLIEINSPEQDDRRITKAIYPTIAKKFNSTPQKVERAIRFAVEVTCNRVYDYEANTFFRHFTETKTGRPSNSEFIMFIAEKVKLQNKDYFNYKKAG